MSDIRRLPIGKDDFRKLREDDFYYIDKTLMIRDFIETKDETALIARPRRFDKTLNMTMMREFFDVTKDSKKIFKGLAIMDTEYASQINSRPVIYFTFKSVKGCSVEELTYQLKRAIGEEYGRYEVLFRGRLEKNSAASKGFYKTYDNLMDNQSSYFFLSGAIADLTKIVYEFYQILPILLIDEYDQPIMSSYEYGYHDQLVDFFSNFYGDAMKAIRL